MNRCGQGQYTAKVHVSLGDEDLREFNVVLNVTYHTEWDSGADADGNRGLPRDFIDDTKVEDILDFNTGESVEEQLTKQERVLLEEKANENL